MAKATTKKAKAATNAKRAANNKAKAARVTKAEPAKVKGWPNITVVTGKGVTDRTVADVVSVNRGQDNAAVLNDGSTHLCSKHLRAGIVVKRGINWDNANKDYLTLMRKEEEAKAVLAKGVDGKFTEHSRKAAADNRRNSKKESTMAKETKKAARKAERAAKAAPKADDTRSIKLLDKKFSFGGEGTARRASWDACLAAIKAKTGVQGYLKAGGKAKYLPRWASAGAISLS